MKRLGAFLSLSSLSLLALAGCGDDETDPNPTPAGAEVAVAFTAQVGAEAFACGSEYMGIGATSSPLTVKDMRFYVHDVRLVDDEGNEVPVTLEQDGKWQQGTVALLDFEDGTNGCDAGNPDTNVSIRGTVPEASTFTGIRFTMGVPFDVNHADAATAPAPLNLTSLWWNWNGGYKFIRIDGSTPGLDAWRFHLGSTACDGDMSGNVTTCGNPNRVEVAIDGFDPTASSVVFDLAAMLEGVDLETNSMDTPPGCMAAPVDPDCELYFQNLGLPWDGASAGAQLVFRAGE